VGVGVVVGVGLGSGQQLASYMFLTLVPHTPLCSTIVLVQSFGFTHTELITCAFGGQGVLVGVGVFVGVLVGVGVGQQLGSVTTSTYVPQFPSVYVFVLSQFPLQTVPANSSGGKHSITCVGAGVLVGVLVGVGVLVLVGVGV